MDESTAHSDSEEYSEDYSGSEDDSNVLQKSSRLARQKDASSLQEGQARKKKKLNESTVAVTEKLAENVKKERKNPRPSLKDSKLIGPDGLIRIKKEFPSKLKYRHPSSKAIQNTKSRQQRLELEVDAAALYSSQLLSAYASFCQELMPSWNYKDTLHKIEDLGSKKLVRDYLQSMRNEVCKEHLEELYGKEKAERWKHELEHGLSRVNDFILGDTTQPLPETNESPRGNSEIEHSVPSSTNQIEVQSRRASTDDQVEEKEMQFEDEYDGFEDEQRKAFRSSDAAEYDEPEVFDDEEFFSSHRLNHKSTSEKANEGPSLDDNIDPSLGTSEKETTSPNLDDNEDGLEKDGGEKDEMEPDDSITEQVHLTKGFLENDAVSLSQDEKLIFDSSQNFHFTGECSQEQLIFDVTQDFNETQTYVPTMTMDENDDDFSSQ
jgi:hypothetical protein